MRLNTTAIVAWWGALLSTTVFLWDIYKYRHAGPKLHFETFSNRVLVGGGMRQHLYEGKRFILCTVTNRGDRPTTVTNLWLEHYNKPRRPWRRNPENAAVIRPNDQVPIPYELNPGTRWNGMVEQNEEIETWAKSYLYVLLYHSHRDKPLRLRVVIPPRKDSIQPG